MPDNRRFSNGDEGDGWRTQPMYTISEAARLAHVSSSTVRRWLFGYRPDKRFPQFVVPPVLGDAEVSPYVSFLQLVELVVASEFRRVSRVKLDVVAQAHTNLRNETDIPYPFAHEELELLGGHVIRWLHRNGGTEVESVDTPQQAAMSSLVERRIHESAERHVRTLEFIRQLASRWYPVGKQVPIVVDPLFSSGIPTIDGRGVTVGAIYRRWKADPHDNIRFIADDLQLDAQLVEQVLKYADTIAA